MAFADKVVLVTGAGRGLGKAIALRFGQGGAKVIVNDINPDTSAMTARAIVDSGGRAMSLIADVANKMAVQTMHYEILEAWKRVDILINHAAIEPSGAILALDEWAWDRTFNVNLKGAFLCTQVVGRGMKEQGGGVIVNLLRRASGPGDRAAYAASQAGLAGFTRECAREFAAHNIRVNAVCAGALLADDPGPVEGLMKKPLERLPRGQPGAPAPGDVAGLVLYLCSEEAAPMTGQLLNADGNG